MYKRQSMSRAPIMSPGIIPARNRSLTDAPEAMPYMMNGILGGMITPSPPATATIAVENVRS